MYLIMSSIAETLTLNFGCNRASDHQTLHDGFLNPITPPTICRRVRRNHVPMVSSSNTTGDHNRQLVGVTVWHGFSTWVLAVVRFFTVWCLRSGQDHAVFHLVLPLTSLTCPPRKATSRRWPQKALPWCILAGSLFWAWWSECHPPSHSNTAWSRLHPESGAGIPGVFCVNLPDWGLLLGNACMREIGQESLSFGRILTKGKLCILAFLPFKYFLTDNEFFGPFSQCVIWLFRMEIVPAQLQWVNIA